MTKLFIIRNQNGQYLSKQQEWLDGGDRNSLYRTVHHDEAINTVFEVSSRDIYLRAETLACAADARGNPLLGEGAVPAREAELPVVDAEIAAEGDTPVSEDEHGAVDQNVGPNINPDVDQGVNQNIDQDEATA